MKKWENPTLKDLNYKFTKDPYAPGYGNGQTPIGCYCDNAQLGGHGTPHNHGSKRKPNQKCKCCETNAGLGWTES